MEGPGSGQQRVKVYKLNEEGLWDDKGTGHVTVEIMDQVSTVGGRRQVGRDSRSAVSPPAAVLVAPAAAHCAVSMPSGLILLMCT